ncbi:hypothetical protein [Spiroplasma endosymbiont of Stenodema calcarata]|uniref:hypothetical protein n=1 Tax=Spiroplasma endosymbiont of Stenodema calcarata TaxID=3139328 RepID=UPI003CCAC3DE
MTYLFNNKKRGYGIKPAITYALIKYIGIVKIPGVGWVAGALAGTFATSVAGIIGASQLWNYPNGMVMAFTGTIYSGRWYQ